MVRDKIIDKAAGMKRMGKPKKEVMARVLKYNEDMTDSNIGKWLGVSDSTARRYAVATKTPDSLVEFEREFALIVRGMQYEGIAKVNERLLTLLENERKISEVVKAGEYFQGGRAKSEAPNIQVNIANILDKEREEYTLVDN